MIERDIEPAKAKRRIVQTGYNAHVRHADLSGLSGAAMVSCGSKLSNSAMGRETKESLDNSQL